MFLLTSAWLDAHRSLHTTTSFACLWRTHTTTTSRGLGPRRTYYTHRAESIQAWGGCERCNKYALRNFARTARPCARSVLCAAALQTYYTYVRQQCGSPGFEARICFDGHNTCKIRDEGASARGRKWHTIWDADKAKTPASRVLKLSWYGTDVVMNFCSFALPSQRRSGPGEFVKAFHRQTANCAFRVRS